MQISWEWRLTWVNLLITANVIIYILGLIFSYILFTNQLQQGYTAFHLLTGGATYTDLFNGELWRLTASSFLHALSPWHLVLNMWALWMVGQRLQNLYSGRWLLIFYIFGGTFGTALSLPLLPNVYTVGASAAVFAYVGVYLAASFRRRYNSIDLGVDTSELWPYALILFFGFFSPDAGINTFAHIFGFLVGVAMGWLIPHSAVVKPHPGWKNLETFAFYVSLIWLAFVFIMAGVNIFKFFSIII